MTSLLDDREFRALLAETGLARLASSATSVLLGVSIYHAAGTALALGWLGLSEAIPAIGLVLYGGHVADRHNRRRVVLAARVALALLAAILAIGSAALSQHVLIWLIYGVAFLTGCTRAFDDPASSGLEAQIVPAAQAVRGASILGAVSRGCSLVGPVFGGFAFDILGPAITYGTISAVLSLSVIAIWLFISPKPAPPASGDGAGAMVRIIEGIRYVFGNQILVGSSALDLFAVFFGGVAGLLPIFATDILHIGTTGVGLLRAAASAGSLTAMLIAARHPPRARAGIALHIAIAGFGVAIIGFGLSTNFMLSMALLALAGGCDGVSMVVRQAILRVVSPDAMRGRIAAVRSVFISSSNELGDFESGIAASLVGPAAAVWGGGIMTLVIVVITAFRAPKLLHLDLGSPQHAPDQPRAVARPIAEMG